MKFTLKKTDLIKITGSILCFLALPATFAKASYTDHQKLVQEEGCFTCHYMPPVTASGSLEDVLDARLKSGGEKWCLSCHAMEEKTLHPTGIPADPDAGLPLAAGNSMSCLTCHSPHQKPFDDKPWAPDIVPQNTPEGHKTFLLNTPNDKGQLCARCHDGSAALRKSMHTKRAYDTRNYAGSKSCAACHADIYEQWVLSPHARMTRKLDSVENHTEIPLEEMGFPRENIKWVLGSHYIHRFVAQASETLVVLPKIWDRNKKKWLPAHDYGWKSRYWLKQCAGCHTTGFSAENDSFVEPGVGCESCHGPGLNHTKTQSPEFIVAPDKLPEDRSEMICESCHTSGIDNTGEYHFPVGYRPGKDLTRYFSGLTPKPGQSPENFHGDETYADRRRQWEFLKSRFLLASGLTCDYCQNFRQVKTRDNSMFMSYDEYCLSCHTDLHDHPPESPGQNCAVCHRPAMNASGTVSIHDHRFIFLRDNDLSHPH